MNLEGWVVKIPGHGTPDRWTAEDEHMLVQEVETMRLINLHTDVPSPWVVDYSATLDNKFGFPYIVMKELPGKSATDLWFEDHCEVPSPETEQKRLTFLRSLARHMTELEKLQFDQIGIPKCKITGDEYYEIYEEIEDKRLPVDKYYVWPYYDTYASVERGPAPNATFTLRHSDLDTQNLLIDATGAITGILDWDASLAMPRCVGHASVPHFLDRDFHRNSILRSPFLCWRAPHYRAVYAAALREAGNPDAAYTAKSHMYQAAFAALYEGGDQQDFIARILGEVSGLRVEVHAIKFLLAKGCTATREMLVRELGKVLDPELPPVGFLEGVEEQLRDAVVQGWMDGFEHFFETGVVEM
ncbi:hypothetical protein EJ07DRAFT_130265 [Lizonia empirigonia]|nr:hypothetical protein EJ07DRAFT_130265 [Lizonia empirigonia]